MAGNARSRRSNSAPRTAQPLATPAAQTELVIDPAPDLDQTPEVPIVAARPRRGSSIWLLGGSSLLILVVVLVGAILLNNTQGPTCPDNLLACGSVAPDFTLPQVPGMQPVQLSSFRGHPVLLELFASWCPVCHAEAPILESLDAANRRRGLVILSVVASPNDHNSEGSAHPTPTSPDDLRWYVASNNVKHRVLYDPKVADSLASQAAFYHVGGFPTLYLVDKLGIIHWSGVGLIALSDLQAQVDKVL